jgi:hypothetical protein
VKIAQFETTPEERKLIQAIAQRAHKTALNGKIKYPVIEAAMDITACHCNGCRLDLQKLLDAPEGDFGHDVLGIRKFIDRTTGEINRKAFQPRCALPVSPPWKWGFDEVAGTQESITQEIQKFCVEHLTDSDAGTVIGPDGTEYNIEIVARLVKPQ